ncbi:unnamed protein product [Rhodiola kirilowii]
MAYSRQSKFIGAVVVILGLYASMSMARVITDTDSFMRQRHEEWMAQHGREYSDTVEKEKRFKIFKANVEHIELFNSAAGRSYRLSINEFADLTNEEFRNARNGYRGFSSGYKSPNSMSFKYENATAVPLSMDWRQQGAVTPVKNQGTCGCCWAFSAVAAVEGINQLSTGKLVSLSEQELVDCDSTDQGCGGGLMDNAFDFIQQNGLTTETNYPYQGVAGTCITNQESSNAAASITGHEDVPANSESSLLKAVANQPVSVAIDASGQDFQFYSGGVYAGPCGTSLDHGVTAVGYGTSDDGAKFWLVKNSWGSSWGEEGYIRMQRDVDAEEGLCGIAMKASYPTA